MTYKYQDEFATKLTERWEMGDCVDVRTTIRNLKNKAQSAYIAGQVVYKLAIGDLNAAAGFISFMHPDYK